jgi:hypothetical protein
MKLGAHSARSKCVAVAFWRKDDANARAAISHHRCVACSQILGLVGAADHHCGPMAMRAWRRSRWFDPRCLHHHQGSPLCASMSRGALWADATASHARGSPACGLDRNGFVWVERGAWPSGADVHAFRRAARVGLGCGCRWLTRAGDNRQRPREYALAGRALAHVRARRNLGLGSEFMRLFLVDLTTGSRVPSPCGKPRSERASYLRSWHHFAAKVPLYP